MGKKDDDSSKPESHIFRRPIQDKATRKVSALPRLIKKSERPDGEKAQKVDDGPRTREVDVSELEDEASTSASEPAEGAVPPAGKAGKDAKAKGEKGDREKGDDKKADEKPDGAEGEDSALEFGGDLADELDIDDGGLFDDAFDDLFDD